MAILPNNPDIGDTLGWILLHTGSRQESLALLRSSARARPESGTIQYHLAVAYERNGNNDEALEVLERALAGSPFPERGEAEALLQKIKGA